MINFLKTKKIKNICAYSYIIILTILSYSCAAPRFITNSGKVTPHKQFRFGGNFSGNFSTSIATSLFDGAISTATDLINEDTVKLEESVTSIEKIALSYSLDPIGTGYDFYLRYGICKRLDAGYKFASGVHAFDAAYQFLGSTGTINNPEKNGMCGSVGLQFSSQSYDLPFGLNKIQKFLGFELERIDFLLPIIFSAPIGEEEKYGAFSFGFAYNYSIIKYSFDPKNIYTRIANSSNLIEVKPISKKKSYHSFGTFINVKAGYKYVYLIASLAMYYQNYGNYEILNEKFIHISGLTIIPTIGLQFSIFEIPRFHKKNTSSTPSL